jgi:hypothetical protein
MRESRKPLAILALLFLCTGLIKSFMAEPGQRGPIDMIMPLAIAVCLFWWCKADARERNISPGSAPALVGLAAPIGLPYYFFRYPGGRKAWMACLKACGFLLLLMFLFAVGSVPGLLLRERV